MKKIDWAHFLLRLVLGGLLVVASLDKILHPEAFSKIIYNYQILPGGMINGIAIVLPWLELTLGFLLLSGLLLPGATLWVGLLLTGFWTALVFNLARGLDIQCGCFSTTPEESASTAWYVFRDGIFLVMGATLLVLTAKRFSRLVVRENS